MRSRHSFSARRSALQLSNPFQSIVKANRQPRSLSSAAGLLVSVRLRSNSIFCGPCINSIKDATNAFKGSVKWKQIRFVISSHFAKRRTSHERPNVAGYVSNAIKRLEEELGSDLFRRSKNGAKLSSLGVDLDQINECAEGARREAAYISTADMLSIPARAKYARKIFYGTAICGLCSFCWSTIRSPALLRDGNALCGQTNCRRSRFGSDNRYETSAAADCAVRGLSIGAPN